MLFYFLKEKSKKQALEHTIAKIKRNFKNVLDNSEVKQFDELESRLNKFCEKQNFKDIYTEIKTSFDELIQSKDYNEILKVFNNKGLISNSSVAKLCDLSTKNNAYLNYIIGILKQNNENSKVIKQAIINKIEKNA